MGVLPFCSKKELRSPTKIATSSRRTCSWADQARQIWLRAGRLAMVNGTGSALTDPAWSRHRSAGGALTVEDEHRNDS